MALGLTQPLTEMSTRNISWGDKGGRCVELTTLPPSCANCLEIWEPQPAGTLRDCPGLDLHLGNLHLLLRNLHLHLNLRNLHLHLRNLHLHLRTLHLHLHCT